MAQIQGRNIRMSVDEPLMVSIIDFIATLCQCTNGAATSRFNNSVLRKVDLPSFVKYGFISSYKCVKTPAVNADDCVTVALNISPGYPLADQFKRLCCQMFDSASGVKQAGAFDSAGGVKHDEAETISDWKMVCQALQQRHKDDIDALINEIVALKRRIYELENREIMRFGLNNDDFVNNDVVDMILN